MSKSLTKKQLKTQQEKTSPSQIKIKQRPISPAASLPVVKPNTSPSGTRCSTTRLPISSPDEKSTPVVTTSNMVVCFTSTARNYSSAIVSRVPSPSLSSSSGHSSSGQSPSFSAPGPSACQLRISPLKACSENKAPRNSKPKVIPDPLTLTYIMLDQLNLVQSCEMMLSFLEKDLITDIENGASLDSISESLKHFCRIHADAGYYDPRNRFNIIAEVWYRHMQLRCIEIHADLFKAEKYDAGKYNAVEFAPWRHNIHAVLSVLE